MSGERHIGIKRKMCIRDRLQEVLQLLFSDIINIYCNRIQFMCVLLRMCLAIELSLIHI